MTLELEKVKATIQRAIDLPTLPSVATTLSRMVATPNVSAAEIGKLIAEDQALTAKVLRVVNSAYYGFPQQINNVTHAIVILGYNKVRDVVLTASVLEAFEGKADEFDFTEFWEHSIAVAIAADTAAKVTGASCGEDAFVSGLLHDIGKLVMAAYFPEDFGKAIDRAHKKNVLLRDAENELMEFDHAAVGRILAQKWSFSEILTEAIHRHHAPAVARKNTELACVVHLADIVARALLAGNSGDRKIPALDPAAREELKLTRELLDQLFTETVHGLRRGKAFFDLIQASAGASS